MNTVVDFIALILHRPIASAPELITFKQIFNSQTERVRTRGRPKSRWWRCVCTDVKKGRITNWKKTSRNTNEWKKPIEAKVQLGL
jgi:hypothetical protein